MNKKKEAKIKFLKNARKKEVLGKILYVILIFCIISNIVLVLNSVIKKIDYFNLMGISLIPMESKSMEKEIPKNSLVVTKSEVKENNTKKGIEVNNNIAYIVNGKLRINKVVSIETIDGETIYRTKSNANYNMDVEKITENMIIGKVINVIPVLGILFKILQSKITTAIIVFLLIMYYLYNKRVYKNKVKRKVTLIKNERKGDNP